MRCAQGFALTLIKEAHTFILFVTASVTYLSERDVIGAQQVGTDQDVLVAQEIAALAGFFREQACCHALEFGLVSWGHAVPHL